MIVYAIYGTVDINGGEASPARVSEASELCTRDARSLMYPKTEKEGAATVSGNVFFNEEAPKHSEYEHIARKESTRNLLKSRLLGLAVSF